MDPPPVASEGKVEPGKGQPHGRNGEQRSQEGEMSKNLKPAEEQALRDQVSQGAAQCPRCDSVLTMKPIPPRTDVAYVRDRVLLTCSECEIRVVVDRK
jgi:hypothetical protein